MVTSNVAQVIDELGCVQADIAILEVREAELKKKLFALPAGQYHGDLFDASVIKSVRFTLPILVAKAKLKALGVGRKWFAANAVETPVLSVKLTARTGIGHNSRRAA